MSESSYARVETLLADVNKDGPSLRVADELCRMGRYVRDGGLMHREAIDWCTRQLHFWPEAVVTVQLQTAGAVGMELVLKIGSEAAVLLY